MHAETAGVWSATTEPLHSDLARTRRSLRRRLPASAWIALVALLALTVTAISANLLAPFDPESQHLLTRLQPPSFLGGTGSHLLGSDSLGRDIFSRVIYGARVSLVVGLASVALAGTIGVSVGLFAAYAGSWWDTLFSRLADIQQAIPFLILAIAAAVIVGAGLWNVIAVLAAATWVTYFRITRAEALSVRARLWVDAARVMGASAPRIILRHILPNVAGSIVVVASLMVGNMILYEASLSFLGLGVQPPTPTWGRMVLDGVQYLDSAWWISLFPGLAIVLTVVAINLVGDGLRDALAVDP